MCRHVYESVQKINNSVQKGICPLCAQCTHEIDWAEQHRLHKEWIASGKASKQGWWSI